MVYLLDEEVIEVDYVEYRDVSPFVINFDAGCIEVEYQERKDVLSVPLEKMYSAVGLTEYHDDIPFSVVVVDNGYLGTERIKKANITSDATLLDWGYDITEYVTYPHQSSSYVTPAHLSRYFVADDDYVVVNTSVTTDITEYYYDDYCYNGYDAEVAAFLGLIGTVGALGLFYYALARVHDSCF